MWAGFLFSGRRSLPSSVKPEGENEMGPVSPWSLAVPFGVGWLGRARRVCKDTLRPG